MRRVYIETRVSNIDEATRFYAAVFGRPPTQSAPGLARWTLDDPGVDFAICARPAGRSPSVSALS